MHLLEFRKLNLQLESLKSDLEKRNAELKQFSYVISHDIKSPLASIVLSTEMLREHFGENIDEDNIQMLNILNRSSLKIRNLAEGVQAFYRSESSLNEDAEAFELVPFFASVSEIFQSNQGLELPVIEQKKNIYTKKTALELILVNLIQNAFKFNDKAKPVVQVRYSEDEFYYLFVVSDNGMGLTTEEQERIVELFTSSGHREKFGTQSSGTGLPTVKRLVQRLSGRIELRSTEGEGSEFSFTIKKHR
jgi:signal transduction histidine kinase